MLRLKSSLENLENLLCLEELFLQAMVFFWLLLIRCFFESVVKSLIDLGIFLCELDFFVANFLDKAEMFGAVCDVAVRPGILAFVRTSLSFLGLVMRNEASCEKGE